MKANSKQSPRAKAARSPVAANRAPCNSISAAFFISPGGKAIFVTGKHISDVLQHPAKFGVSRNEMEALHIKYNEKLGLEGKAREEILVGLIRKGWIRIRRYPNTGWSINISELNEPNRAHLLKWAVQILTGVKGFRELDEYMPVRVTPLTGPPIPSLTIKELAAGRLDEISGQVPPADRTDIVWADTYDQMPDIDKSS